MIQDRALTKKASFPKDFIAQLLTIGEPGPNLSVLEWFLIEFGDSSGYYGFGCTRQELELPENARAKRFVRIGMDRHMDSCLPGEKLFTNISSLKGAKAFINCFHDDDFVMESLLAYIFEEYASDPRDDRWIYFTGVLETYLETTWKPGDDMWFKRVDSGRLLIGHAILYLLEGARGYEPNLDDLIGCLKFVKKHDANVLLHENSNQSTVLDICLTKSDLFYGLTEVTEEDEIPSHQFALVVVLVQENPDACLLRNSDGQLPIHVAFELSNGRFRNDLINTIQEAAPRVAERRCLSSGLYPFQIAATMVKDRSGCGCSYCSSEKVGVSLSCVYSLLRLCPTLITDAISAGDTKLSHWQSIEIAKNRLEVSRKRIQFEEMKEELADAEIEISRKQRRLDVELADETDEIPEQPKDDDDGDSHEDEDDDDY